VFIPEECVQKFNLFVNNHSDVIDTWLSPRLIADYKNTLGNFRNKQYKHFGEFRFVNGSDLLARMAHTFNLEYKTLLDLDEPRISRPKRSSKIDRTNTQRVVGKYSSYNQVIIYTHIYLGDRQTDFPFSVLIYKSRMAHFQGLLF
jgi:hypothetical protein